MKKKFDVSFYAGKYTDAQGQEKARRFRCGSVLQDDQGRFKLVLESLPVGVSTERGGLWFDLYAPNQGQQSQNAPQQPARDDFTDDVPF